jgi:hypothetical protein
MPGIAQRFTCNRRFRVSNTVATTCPTMCASLEMILADAPRDWEVPAFWHELDDTRSIVHVTQGTIANAAPTLIAPVPEGLAKEDVLVVVATGGRAPDSIGLRNVPRNARIGTFPSHPDLLPKTSVMVTNGAMVARRWRWRTAFRWLSPVHPKTNRRWPRALLAPARA